MDHLLNHSANMSNHFLIYTNSPQFSPQIYYIDPQMNPFFQNIYYPQVAFLETNLNMPILQTSFPEPLISKINKSPEKLQEPLPLSTRQNQLKEKKQQLDQQRGQQWSMKKNKTIFINNNQRFIMKNTQSNVINQVLSFLWTYKKNHYYLSKIFKQQQQIDYFCLIFNFIKINCKSEFKRQFLKMLIRKENLSSSFIKRVKNHFNNQEILYKFLTSKEFGQGVRKLTFIYLRKISRCTIMTSRKMNYRLWKLHFQKCQEIIDYLFNSKNA